MIKDHFKLFNGGRMIGNLFSNPRMDSGVKIKDLKPGTVIVTGGGNTGTITGRKTSTSIQIKLSSGELIGEYDWVDKEAEVKKVV